MEFYRLFLSIYIVSFTLASSVALSAVCWKNQNCPDGEEFCQDICSPPHSQCLASYHVDVLGTAIPAVFGCTFLDDEACLNPECDPTSLVAGKYSCCCTGDLCNAVYGITPTGSVPTPAPPVPSVPPGYQLCEFYNCSFVNDPATQSCHGYIPCTKDYQEDTHQNHFCHTIFHKRTNGLYELYSKGCHFSLLSRCDGRNECILDTSPEGRELTYCCCDGELCNVNVTYTHPENVDGGASGDATLCKDCDHSCDIINEDPVCFCHEGYALSAVDMKSCVDIDECALGTHDCQANCSNVEGGYNCSCPEHLKLADDGKTCEDPGLVCELVSYNPMYTYGIDHCANFPFAIDPANQHCHATFLIVDGIPLKKLAGCFFGSYICSDNLCYAKYLSDDMTLLHCCCNGNLCNRNVVFPNTTSV